MQRLTRRASWCLGSLLAAFILLGIPAALAAAQENEEAIRLDYRSSEGCPDRVSFLNRVRARMTGARLAPSETISKEARTFDVQVAAGRPAWGRASVGDPSHPEGTRVVEAETCEDVADALALVVALAVDPRGASPPTAPPAPVESGAPSSIQSSVPPPIASAPASPSLHPTQAPVGQNAIEESGARSSTRRSPRGVVLAGLDAALDVGVTPVAVVGLSGFVGWQSRSAALFSPSLRLALDHAQSGTIPVPGGTAAFDWTVGRLDGCPLARPFRSLHVAACARIEIGALDVAGGDIVAPRTKLRLWLSTGALVRGEWTFFDPLFLNVEAGANVRATNDRFLFLPHTTVYEVPLVGLSSAAGLGTHFF